MLQLKKSSYSEGSKYSRISLTDFTFSYANRAFEIRKFELEQPGFYLTVNTKNFRIIELLRLTTAFRSF